MAVSSARALAFEILLRVGRENSYAGELLHSASLSKIPSRDHGLATELVMGVLRWRSLLDQRLAAASLQKLERLDDEVVAALRLGAYQLQFLSRIPARAAIFESVELVKAARKRSAAPFVNAVLRKIAARDVEESFAEIGKSSEAVTLAQNAAHPPWLVKRWADRYGLEITRRICVHDQTVPETAIHIHDDRFHDDRSHDDHSQDDRVDTEPADAELAAAGVQLAPGKLVSKARRVLSFGEARGDVTATRAYRAGRIAILDEASQLVALLASQGRSSAGHKVLDCCAAPGGKTGMLARRDPSASVFATELHPHRARLLQKLQRAPNVHVVAADACHLPFSFSFDQILADVPCSGTGTLGRNPEIKWRLKLEDLYDLQSRQIAILKSALAQLAIGGRLVYSTCSLEPEENEAVVDAVVKDVDEFRVIECKEEMGRLRRSGELCWKDIGTLLAGPYLRTIPGVHPCDGFFAALIERR